MNKKLKKLSCLGLFLLAVVALGACDNDDSLDSGGDVSSGRDTLAVALDEDIPNLDLHGSNTQVAAQVNLHIFETLIYQDENMDLHPGLATSWELVEFGEDHDLYGRVWEFTLRQGVYFHNGEPFTAADVEFTFVRASDSAHVAPILGQINVDTIEIIDDHTIRVGTYEPFAPLLSHLAHTAAGIMNEVAVVEAGAEVGQLPVGTGPFRFVEWEIGESVLLERFEDYHAQIPQIPAPLVRELTFVIIPEATTRAIELEVGRVDIDLNPVSDDFDRIEESEDRNLVRAQGLRTQYVGMNLQNDFLSDQRVRHAISYVVDTEEILTTILNSNGIVGTTPITPNVFGHNPNVEPFPYDVDRARQLMEEAGFADGFELTLMFGEDSIEVSGIVQAVANQLAEINIQVELIQLEWPTFLDAVFEGEADMFFISWGTVTGDADYGLHPLFHSSNTAQAGNLTFLENDELDELLDAARVTIVEEERLELYFAAQELLRELAPWLLIQQADVTIAINASIGGLTVAPIGTHYLGNIYFTE